jgi:hypothetical protein
VSFGVVACGGEVWIRLGNGYKFQLRASWGSLLHNDQATKRIWYETQFFKGRASAQMFQAKFEIPNLRNLFAASRTEEEERTYSRTAVSFPSPIPQDSCLLTVPVLQFAAVCWFHRGFQFHCTAYTAAVEINQKR